MKEYLARLLENSIEFIEDTLSDFVSCWRIYPNVLIWCGLVILIAVFV